MPIGGIIKSFANPINLMQWGMGPAGWASILMRSVISAAGQQLIQQLGDKLGLPQSVIDMAQSRFCASCGDMAGAFKNVREAAQSIGEEYNLSPSQEGQFERELNDIVNQMASSLAESKEFKEAKSSGGKSWIMALAEGLGKKLDKKAKELEKLASQINDKKPSTTTKYGAAAQEFSVLMNAANTAIKTLGEAVAGMARKQ